MALTRHVMNEPRYKGAYSLGNKEVQSEPFPTLGAAQAWLHANAPRRKNGYFKRARILKEHDRGINDGVFFLHLIVN